MHACTCGYYHLPLCCVSTCVQGEHDWIAQVVGLSSVVPGDPDSTLAHPKSIRTDTKFVRHISLHCQKKNMCAGQQGRNKGGEI